MKTMKKNGYVGGAVLAAGLLVTGCATEQHQNATSGAVDGLAKTESIYAKNRAPKVADIVKETDSFWVSKRSISITDDAEMLPPAFRTNVQITYNPRASFKDVSTQLAKASGLRFSFASDLADEASAPLLQNNFRADAPLRQVLDQLAAQENVSWRYRDGVVEIYRYETKTFRISVIPGTSTSFTANISNQSQSGNGDGGGGSGASSLSGHNMTVKTDVKMWDNVKNDIKTLLSPKGRYSVSEYNNSVTVTDTPQGVNAVDSYIRALNDNKTRSVMISVEVYAVESNSSDNYALTWGTVFRNLSNRYSVIMTSNLSTASNDAAGKLSAIIDRTSDSPWAGSQAVLQAISAIGTTSLVTSASQITVSGEPVPVHVTKEVNYLKSISTSTNTQTGTQTSLTPGVATAGFSLNSTPVILDGDYVLLQEAIDISSLDKIDSFKSGTSEIQLPQKSNQAFLNKVKLRSGQTLMMTGFQQAAHFFNNTGTGRADLMLLGGGKASNSKMTTLVILVTPVIINS